MKLIIKFVLLAGAIYLFWMFFLSKKNSEPLFSFTDQTGSMTFNIREKEKEEFKIYLKKFKSLIYQEATNHNPQGDVLPDQIDDQLIQEVKEKVN